MQIYGDMDNEGYWMLGNNGILIVYMIIDLYSISILTTQYL